MKDYTLLYITRMKGKKLLQKTLFHRTGPTVLLRNPSSGKSDEISEKIRHFSPTKFLQLLCTVKQQ